MRSSGVQTGGLAPLSQADRQKNFANKTGCVFSCQEPQAIIIPEYGDERRLSPFFSSPFPFFLCFRYSYFN